MAAPDTTRPWWINVNPEPAVKMGGDGNGCEAIHTNRAVDPGIYHPPCFSAPGLASLHPFQGERHPAATFGNRNMASRYVIMVIPLSLARFLQAEDEKQRLFFT